MNIVLLGYGSIGKYYLKLLKRFNYENIFIIDLVNSEKKISKNIYFLNFNKFKRKKIKADYAFICTPSNCHFEQAKYFIKNNVNVLIEKPFVLKYNDALKLVNLLKKRKIKCWTVFQNRINPSVKISKKLISKNYLGDINFIDCKLVWKRNKQYYN